MLRKRIFVITIKTTIDNQPTFLGRCLGGGIVLRMNQLKNQMKYRSLLLGFSLLSSCQSGVPVKEDFVKIQRAQEALELPTVQEVFIPSTLDNHLQPAMFYAPSREGLTKLSPLLVSLHTWSSNYKQKLHQPLEDYCLANGWAYIHPNFRGPNRNPHATGSKRAVQDVLDAVDYARKHAEVDEGRIFLIGASGGGYMSLLMAGQAPDLWAGVSAWASIADLAAWYAETHERRLKYAREILLSCGGAPGSSAKVDEEYRQRSPLTHLSHAKGRVRLDINAGIRDGHRGSTSIRHSLLAFNAVAELEDQFSENLMAELASSPTWPPGLASAISDSSYGDKPPLLRRSSALARITIFDGGHEMLPAAALHWLAQQGKAKAPRPSFSTSPN